MALSQIVKELILGIMGGEPERADEVINGLEGGSNAVQTDGSTPFTAPQGGIDPVASSDLATKNYVDHSPSGSISALTGDVTASGSGSVVATIANNAVTNAKSAQMAAHTFKGNNTGSTANAIDLNKAQLTAELNAFTNTLQGVVPASGGGTTNFLRADGTWAAAGGGSGANTALSNLASVAFNADLIPDADLTRNIGSAAVTVNNFYVSQIWRSTGLVMDTNAGALYNAGQGKPSVIFNADRLHDSSTDTDSVDYANRILLDTNAANQIEWGQPGYVYFHANIIPTPDNTKVLGTPAFRFQSGVIETLYDSGSAPVLNSEAHWLVDETSLTSVVFGSPRRLIANDGSTIVLTWDDPNGPSIKYTPGNAVDWGATVPTTIEQALDLLAAKNAPVS